MSALYGPQHEYVAALIERARKLTTEEVRGLAAAWNATPGVAWVAARSATRDAMRDDERAAERAAEWDAAWDAAGAAAWEAEGGSRWSTPWSAARSAACDTALALVVRDLIPAEHYDTLTLPWRTVIGRIHPDDAEVLR